MGKRLSAIALAAAVLMSGCASTPRSPTETFVIRTTPPGAQASSTQGWECVTPCSVEIPRRGDFVVALRKEGYMTKTVRVRSVKAPPTPNVGSRVHVNTGMVGSAANALLGTNLEHQPNPLEVQLDEEP